MPHDNKRHHQRSSHHDHRKGRGHHNQPQKPTVTEESSDVLKAFLGYQHALDDKHDRYERMIKLSRDVTIESKRAIFTMQRVTGTTERDLKSLKDAQEKIDLIHKDKFYPLAVELIGQDPYLYCKAYSPGMQEYIEAVSLHRYLTSGELITMKEILPNLTFTHQPPESEESTEISLFLPPIDYLLGIADLTGELMRVAVSSVGQGDFDKPFKICQFLQKIHGAFVAFGNVNRELPRKINVLKASLVKVENVCYTIQIRGSEFPKHILAEMLQTAGLGQFDDDVNYGTDG